MLIICTKIMPSFELPRVSFHVLRDVLELVRTPGRVGKQVIVVAGEGRKTGSVAHSRSATNKRDPRCVASPVTVLPAEETESRYPAERRADA